jgi:hypothetical protein
MTNEPSSRDALEPVSESPQRSPSRRSRKSVNWLLTLALVASVIRLMWSTSGNWPKPYYSKDVLRGTRGQPQFDPAYEEALAYGARVLGPGTTAASERGEEP